MTDAVPYTVPKQPGGIRAFLLALVVHVALLIMLAVGVHWQNEVPAVVEAEVWDMQPREAAPLPLEPEPQPEPQPEPEPLQPPKPATEVPQPQVKEPPVQDPEIALEQERKRKQDEEQKRLAEEKARKEAEEKKRLAEAEQKKRQEQQEAEQKRLAEEKARKEAEEKKRLAEAEQKKRLAQQEAERKRLEQQKAEELAAERRRKEDLARIMGQAGNGGTGAAPKSQGGRADASYVGKLSAKIRGNTVFVAPLDLAGNPAVEYRVELLPDGSIRSIRKLQSSGVRGFDEAVERAIRRSEPYPADNTGTVPSSFSFLHRPKDN